MTILIPILSLAVIGYGVFMIRYAFRHPETSFTLPEDILIRGKIVRNGPVPTASFPQAK